ncbi:MAG: tetratricopeptide repeat protein [Desulfobacteraceae bacterium]
MINLPVLKCWPLILLIFLSGCSSAPQNDKGMLEQKVMPPPAASEASEELTQEFSETPSDSPYYNYLKFQIHKKNRETDKALESLLKSAAKDPDSFYLKKELIALYLYLDKKEKALQAAEEVVDASPDNTDALLILAKLKQMLNFPNEARELYQKILQIDPENKDVYLILGSMYMDIDNTDEAFKVYSKMADQFPNSYTAHFFLGKIHALKKNAEYAEEAFLKTIECNPNLVEPRFELIKIYKSRQAKDAQLNPEIISLYEKILDIEPHNTKAAMELPLYFHKHGRKEKAAEIFAETGTRKADDYDFLMLCAREFIGKKRYKDASIIFTGLLKGAPDSSTLNYLAGMSFDALKQSRKAIHHFLKITPEFEHYKKIVVHTAYLYTEIDALDTAVSFLEKKQAELPGDIDIITYLSSFYEKKQWYEKGSALLEKALKDNPENASLLFRLGIMQDKAGHKDACIDTMKKVIEIEPDNASALNYLGYTYADLGIELDRAEALIKKALEIKPEDGFIMDSLGWVFFKKGQYKKAVDLLLKAAEITSFDPIISEHLGDAYEKMNKMEKALEIYTKALEKSKGNQEDLEDLEKKIKAVKKKIAKKNKVENAQN